MLVLWLGSQQRVVCWAQYAPCALRPFLTSRSSLYCLATGTALAGTPALETASMLALDLHRSAARASTRGGWRPVLYQRRSAGGNVALSCRSYGVGVVRMNMHGCPRCGRRRGLTFQADQPFEFASCCVSSVACRQRNFESASCQPSCQPCSLTK